MNITSIESPECRNAWLRVASSLAAFPSPFKIRYHKRLCATAFPELSFQETKKQKKTKTLISPQKHRIFSQNDHEISPLLSHPDSNGRRRDSWPRGTPSMRCEKNFQADPAPPLLNFFLIFSDHHSRRPSDQAAVHTNSNANAKNQLSSALWYR